MARFSAQCDLVSSYMDGVQVKIAEAYKPPRKVTLPAAYNNKFPESTKNTYDFGLEKSVLEKLAEWKKVRLEIIETRRARFEEKRKQDEETPTPSPPLQSDSILPVKVAPAPETTILTPQPLPPSLRDLHNIDIHVKSNGLDYADFDNDTSSPFDNVELKTINDMEELAQVLQPASQWVQPTKIENILHELTGENRPDESIEEKKSNVVEGKIDERNDVNSENNGKCRNISIIVQELQRELARPYMENWKPWPDLESPNIEVVPAFKRLSISKSTESLLPNPIDDLSESDQKLAKHLGDMGFPLSRAARAIGNLGGEDNKKVVEYLLAVQSLEELGISGDEAEKALALNEYDQEKAKKYHESLSTLKDLGFPEDEASKALLNFDIDRDKALDFLCA